MASNHELRRVRFCCRVATNAPVYVAGTFNGWDPRRDRLWQGPFSEGIHTTYLMLEPGRYEYKFVSGTDWFADPDNPETVDDGFGSVNSVLRVS